MDASVIIPARDAAATLPATLAALAGQRAAASFEVVVVDDGSRDATASIARAAGAPVRVVAGAGEGPAAARNRGAAVAAGAALAFTDADCAPEPGWLAALLAALEAADLVQGRVLPAPGSARGPFDRTISVTAEHGLYETANLGIRRDWFERLGGFESILRPRGGKELGEDVWLGWRARRAGARTAFCAEAVVHHAVFPRGPAGYVGERARLRFFGPLVRQVPELREAFLYRRVFLSRRSAEFDLALTAVAAAALTRRPWLLAGALPYARTLRAEARHWPEHGPLRVGAVQLAADAVGAGALAAGSLRAAAPVL